MNNLWPMAMRGGLLTACLWGSVAALSLDVVGVLALLGYRLATGAAQPATEFGPCFVAAGALTALIAFLQNLRRARSEDLLKAASELLEKGFQTLESTTVPGSPSPRRLSWLTSARLVETAERLGAKISEPSHQDVYREKREYWRSRLYELIFPEPPQGLPSEFYSTTPDLMLAYGRRDKEPLAEKSLAYLYRFIRWQDGTLDPLAEVSGFTEEEIAHMETFGPRGLGQLMAAVRELRKGH